MKTTYLNYPRLIDDIDSKIARDNLEISKFCRENGFSKSTVYRIREHEPLTMKTFLFFVNWIGHGSERYFSDDKVVKRIPIRRVSKREVNPITGY